MSALRLGQNLFPKLAVIVPYLLVPEPVPTVHITSLTGSYEDFVVIDNTVAPLYLNILSKPLVLVPTLNRVESLALCLCTRYLISYCSSAV